MAREKNEDLLSAGTYASSLKPGYFKNLFWQKYTERELKGQGNVFGPVEINDYSSSTTSHIFLITKPIELTALKIRSLPEFDFSKTELLALQVGHEMNNRDSSYSKPADKINKIYLEMRLKKDKRIKESRILLVEGYESNEGEESNLVYQLLGFPLIKEEVQGLLSICESFYDKDGERGEALKILEDVRGKKAQKYINELEQKWESKKQGKQWKFGGSVDPNGYVLGDFDGGPINFMFTEVYPIHKYEKDILKLSGI
jgi:hypothetical protein